MKGVSLLIFLGFFASGSLAQFFNHRPFPTYSLENMPETGFSCRDKILGGYYADSETQCQMFHICVKVQGVGVQDFRFLCPNGTAFDQDHQICAEWEDVDCDSTTLYYSSDNFDLYRIGSGFESKALKYGEDEETFALQRAETGDVRLNREHQAQSINQQRQQQTAKKSRPGNYNNNNNNNNNNHEKDLFKGSSSSNFFNNRNGGKENDDDYDDNVNNANQNRDDVQRRKLAPHKPARRPNNAQQENFGRKNEDRNQGNRYQNNNNNNNNNYDNTNNNNNNRRPVNKQQDIPAHTVRPHHRPTGFVNNFAGSSYVPTTSRPSSSTTLNTDQYTTALNNYKQRQQQQQQQRQRIQNPQESTPSYTVSTPAPFKQTPRFTNPPSNRQTTYDDGQYRPETEAPRNEPENYPSNFPKNIKPTTAKFPPPRKSFDDKELQTTAPPVYGKDVIHDVPRNKFANNNNQRVQNGQFESGRISTPQFGSNYDVQKVKPAQNSGTDKKQIIAPTTFAPNRPFNKNFHNNNNNQNNNGPSTVIPSTFSPKTKIGYSQIALQTTNYRSSTTQRPTANGGVFSSSAAPQYTPTVPRFSSTTPFARSSRYDETQYDDGSYDPALYEEESLKTAHSQNFGSSRNDLIKKAAVAAQKSTTTTAGGTVRSTQKPFYNESPRPFSINSNSQKSSENSKGTTQKITTKPIESPKKKKTKDVSYDYAYYDSNVGSEAEYPDIDTEIKKSSN